MICKQDLLPRCGQFHSPINVAALCFQVLVRVASNTEYLINLLSINSAEHHSSSKNNGVNIAIISVCSYFFPFIKAVMGFELRASHLSCKHSTT
jgi:hypothetical protein